MEAEGPELLDYMKAENAVTQEALRPLQAPNEELFTELTKLADTTPEVGDVTQNLDQYFYLETPRGKSDARLMVRPFAGGAPRMLLDPATMAVSGQHAAIDYFVPSPDGKYVAVGVSLGGSENSVLHVVDAASGQLMAESISRAHGADPSWTDDSKGFYFARLQAMSPGAAASTKYDNVRVYFHQLGTGEAKDVPVFGPDLTSDPALPRNGSVGLQVVHGTRMLLAWQVSGVVETRAMWVRRAEGSPWINVIEHKDNVLEIAIHGSYVYAITKGGEKGAVGNGRVMAFDLAKETFAGAHMVLPESGFILSAGRGTTGLRATQDALYVYGFQDGRSGVIRIPYDKENDRMALSLPFSGSVSALAGDVRRPGVTVTLEGWTAPMLIYAYSPQNQQFTDTGLQPRSPVDMSSITVREVLAESTEGTMVPLSILYRKDLQLDASNPTLLKVYGAYGRTLPPSFDPSLLPWLKRGGIFAVAHARGGGERGEPWHVAGMKTTKQHTIDDFVACARYLIQQKYTSPAHLGIEGTSAGGIAVGGFLTQHPELVGAVLYRVGITDILRSEQRSTGAMNAWEYGSVKVEPEFRAMYAISPYAHVQNGAKYPPVMLETGANDPRVASWMLTKMTARLQAANASANPILLRVDFDAGHGRGSDRIQRFKLQADEYTFLGWQLGLNGFDPKSHH
jgi:prolyl oligopeptidase